VHHTATNGNGSWPVMGMKRGMGSRRDGGFHVPGQVQGRPILGSQCSRYGLKRTGVGARNTHLGEQSMYRSVNEREGRMWVCGCEERGKHNFAYVLWCVCVCVRRGENIILLMCCGVCVCVCVV